ncbi:MAG: hypothetical protein L0312_26320, partial [Acidobacteria bacterium]|nr:hypothetical protein [Acidobacteriota bacterium]
ITPPKQKMNMKYEATMDRNGGVSISRDGVWSTSGRLDTVCLERGEAHIIDADAPLGSAVYDALDEALTEALGRGETSASIEIQ